MNATQQKITYAIMLAAGALGVNSPLFAEEHDSEQLLNEEYLKDMEGENEDAEEEKATWEELLTSSYLKAKLAPKAKKISVPDVNAIVGIPLDIKFKSAFNFAAIQEGLDLTLALEAESKFNKDGALPVWIPKFKATLSQEEVIPVLKQLSIDCKRGKVCVETGDEGSDLFKNECTGHLLFALGESVKADISAGYIFGNKHGIGRIYGFEHNGLVPVGIKIDGEVTESLTLSGGFQAWNFGGDNKLNALSLDAEDNSWNALIMSRIKGVKLGANWNEQVEINIAAEGQDVYKHVKAASVDSTLAAFDYKGRKKVGFDIGYTHKLGELSQVKVMCKGGSLIHIKKGYEYDNPDQNKASHTYSTLLGVEVEADLNVARYTYLRIEGGLTTTSDPKKGYKDSVMGVMGQIGGNLGVGVTFKV